jgi:integrase
VPEKKKTKARRGDGCVYRRGKIWWATWSEPVKGADGNIRRRKRFASSKSERKSDAVTLLHVKVHDSRHRAPRQEGKDPTYEQVRDRWLAHRAAKSKPHLLKDGSAYFAGHAHLDKFFGGWKAANIDTEDIERFQGALREMGLVNGIDRAVASLRSMLRFSALQTKDGLRVDQLPRRFPMVRAERERPRPIAEKYFEPLRGALAEPWLTPFVLGWHSGMRLSELERLAWSHVDLAKKVLRFPSAKSGRWRTVPLLADTADLIGALPRGKPDERVFPNFRDSNTRLLAWRRAAVAAGCGQWVCPQCRSPLVNMKCAEHGRFGQKRAGYDGPSLRHTRHSFIRRSSHRGIPTARIMEMVGHRSVAVNMGYNAPEEDEDLALIRERYDGEP